MRLALLLLLVLIVAGGTFFAGRWHGKQSVESGGERSVVLTEDMAILTEEGEPKGQLPAGTRLYAIPDPWGDRTSQFKLYLRTEVSDEHSLRPSTDKPAHGLERDFYWLKPRQRQDASQRELSGTDSRE